MIRGFQELTVLTLVLSFNVARAADGPAVTPFEADGVVADVLGLFPCALKDSKKVDRARAQTTLKEVAAPRPGHQGWRLCVPRIPREQASPQGREARDRRSHQGATPRCRALLHIDALSKAKGDAGVDLARYEDEEGKAVNLRGTNKCQCGLNVAELPHSCTLGHLHHLEADDGQIYNYLQYGDGKAAFLGEGTHFKNVELKARLFPGHFLLVERGKLLP